MEEEKNEVEVEDEVEELDELEENDQTDWEARAKKAEGIAKRALTKMKKLSETKVEKKVEPSAEPVKKEANPGELDETQLDYLDLKGISDPDEIDIIQKVVAKTGQTVRQALKDDYVTAKLEALRATKAVKDATPGATKRSGNQTGDVASALAKFDSSGELPEDFALRSQVVNAITERSSRNKPAWH